MRILEGPPTCAASCPARRIAATSLFFCPCSSISFTEYILAQTLQLFLERWPIPPGIQQFVWISVVVVGFMIYFAARLFFCLCPSFVFFACMTFGSGMTFWRFSWRIALGPIGWAKTKVCGASCRERQSLRPAALLRESEIVSAFSWKMFLSRESIENDWR